MRRVVLALMLAALPLAAQEKKSAEQAMIDFYVDAAKPVAEHERLAALSGPWKVTTKLWFDPAGEPKVAKGTGKGKMILGGRFLSFEADVKGDLGSQSLSIFGFDRRTGEYTMVGYDTLGTYYITAAGKYEPAEKAVVLRGSYAQPPTGENVSYRFVWTTPAPKEHVLTLYFLTGGKDVRVAETTFAKD